MIQEINTIQDAILRELEKNKNSISIKLLLNALRVYWTIGLDPPNDEHELHGALLPLVYANRVVVDNEKNMVYLSTNMSDNFSIRLMAILRERKSIDLDELRTLMGHRSGDRLEFRARLRPLQSNKDITVENNIVSLFNMPEVVDEVGKSVKDSLKTFKNLTAHLIAERDYWKNRALKAEETRG